MDVLKTVDVLYSYNYHALICLRLKYVPCTVCIVSIVVDMMTSAVHNLLVYIFAAWLAIPKTGSFGVMLPCVMGDLQMTRWCQGSKFSRIELVSKHGGH